MADTNNRYLTFSCPSCTSDLLIESLKGSDYVSGLFSYTARLLSTDADVDFSTIVGQNVTVTMLPPPGANPGTPTRYINAYVTDFSAALPEGSYYVYTATLSPWPWFSSINQRMRIFKGQDISGIISEVVTTNNVNKTSINLTKDYPTMEYCVQYGESDLAFLSRWFEKFGIIYYFTHDEDSHTWVITDDSTAVALPTGEDSIYVMAHNDCSNGMKVITDWVKTSAVRPGQVTLTDYNFLGAQTTLSVVSSTEGNTGNNSQPISQYPGDYQLTEKPTATSSEPDSAAADDGEDTSSDGDDDTTGFSALWGDPLAKVKMQGIYASGTRCNGLTYYTPLNAGYPFTLLKQGYTQGTKYLVLSTYLEASVPDFQSSNSEGDDAFTYKATFTCIEQSIQYYAPATTPWPVVKGPQSAQVVGTSKVSGVPDCDKFGRTQVQFWWDTDGTQTIFLRIAQPWGGYNHGTQFLPAIQDEVIVEFMEGNPDRPIITGSVYNKSNMPPTTLSDNQTQTVISDVAGNTIGMESSSSGPYIQLNQAKNDDGKMNALILDSSAKTEGVRLTDYFGNYVNLDSVKKQVVIYSPSSKSSVTVGPEGVKLKTDYADPWGSVWDPKKWAGPIGKIGKNSAGQWDAGAIVPNLVSQIAGTWTDAIMGVKSSTIMGWYQSTNLGAKTEITAPYKKTYVMGIGESKTITGPMSVNAKSETIIGSESKIRTGDKTEITKKKDVNTLSAIFFNSTGKMSAKASAYGRMIAAEDSVTASNKKLQAAQNQLQALKDKVCTTEQEMIANSIAINAAQQKVNAADAKLVGSVISYTAASQTYQGLKVEVG
ncbi:MAG: type VI secretion system Vgr family protein [Puniceicoccales bacterium]